MFLPPEVMIRSFLRSVIVRKPSASRWPTSPVCSQPSTIAARVRLGVVPVALHDVRAAGQDLAVVGDPDLDAGDRPADGPDLAGVRAVEADDRRALGQAVAFEQRQARLDEPLGDVPRQRGPAGGELPDRRAEDPPEPSPRGPRAARRSTLAQTFS